ncbi:hypothetical protein B0O99DRAFT_655767 [Bisporella sp. PMI_857]|nr:hypothetical protein B0O99DRAFT_655767 [Bisporella sp. PMI_857]
MAADSEQEHLPTPSQSTTTPESIDPTSAIDPPGSSKTLKQAACLNCRKSKTRCLRDPTDVICKRCVRLQEHCVIPDYRIGRKKGIKNKRDGLDKAVYRIEQAIRKSRGKTQDAEDVNTFYLQSLLSEAQDEMTPEPGHLGKQTLHYGMAPSASQPSSSSHANDESGPVDDAENPLQLLARASDLSKQPHALNSSIILPSLQELSRDQDLQAFFGPSQLCLDVGEGLDPIELGLVTWEESEMLFSYFYQNLSHTRWGLDPVLHTPSFVRQRSAFLFTSIIAASALFFPSTAALSKRLSSHCKVLARHIMINRNRSAEIVLGFMVNIPWMSPGKHWSDDETCLYMAMALTIAIDIALDKCLVPSPTHGRGVPKDVPQSETIPARKALDLDGFQDVDPSSLMGRRLLRRRERIWLALFVLDRGVCLARGRSYTVPLTPLIQTCDYWHDSDIQDGWDGSLIASTVLRRDLSNLIIDVKTNCDYHRETNLTVSRLQEMIEGFFNQWYLTWASIAGGVNGNSVPPYVEILVAHGRLSIYSSVVNHPTAPAEVKRFFRAACLSSALNVMRAAVQGEGRLKSMPNNTVIMISFAAMISLRLSTTNRASNRSMAPSIWNLIAETADSLQMIGTNPPHRNGTSALYGRHLRKVLLSFQDGRVTHSWKPSHSTSVTDSNVSTSQYNPPILPVTTMSPEMVQFSAMSDDQIIQAINAAGNEWDNVPNYQIDERNGLDWLDWFNMEIGK